MANKNFIKINGKKYPCYVTMGALMKLEKETGRSVQQLKTESITDLITMLWCQVWGACRREGVAFEYTLEDFADNLDQNTFTQWAQSQADAASCTDDKKKVK